MRIASESVLFFSYMDFWPHACLYTLHEHIVTTVEPVLTATGIERPPIYKNHFNLSVMEFLISQGLFL